MKCLVSGASGFVGRQLCQQLIDRGDAVIALSRTGSPLGDGTSTLALDLTVAEPDSELLRDVDVVFHLAGIAHQRAAESAYQQLNHQATLRLARLAAGAGVKCFVFLSSVKAMGPPLTRRERVESECNAPVDAYGLSKWQAECALRQEFDSAAMGVVILRPALVYGANARGNLRLLARGAQLGLPRPPQRGARSMLALQDLVDLLCRVADVAPSGVHTWIACDDRPYSTRGIYDLLREAGGKGSGFSWLPLWAWWLGAALLDLPRAGRGDSTFDKLFGTEIYSNAAVRAATHWQPRGRLDEAVAAMAENGGGEPT